MKRAIPLLLCIALVGSQAVMGDAYQSVSVNGISYSLERAVISQQATIYISLRDAAAISGYQLNWDSERGRVILSSGAESLEFKQGLSFVDGTRVSENMKNEAVNYNGSVYIPISAMESLFGFKVATVGVTYTLTKAVEGDSSFSYSYDVLLQKALNHSDILENALLSVKANEIKYEEAEDDLDSSPVDTGSTAAEAARLGAYQSYIGNGIAYEMSKRQVETIKDQIAHQLKSAIDQVNLEKLKIRLAEEDYAIKEELLSQAKLKKAVGTLSEMDYLTAENAVITSRSTKLIQEQTLNSAFITLNDMVGLEPQARYQLISTVALTPNSIKDLETHIQDVTKASPSIWNLEQLIDQASTSVRFYVFNAGSDPYEAKEIEVTQAKIDLESAKRSMAEALRTGYTSLITLENNDTLLKAKLNDAENALLIAKQNQQVGLITALQTRQASLAVLAAKEALVANAVSHETALRVLMEPWVQN